MATDEHAAILLHHLVMPIVGLVHDGDIDEADAVLRNTDPDQLRQVAILLAALADPNRPWNDALSWWLDPPARVIPEHADERFEPVDVRALVVERFGLPPRKGAKV